MNDIEASSSANRRAILAGMAAASAIAGQAAAQARPAVRIPVIDSHIHLFDGTRPQGATYMGSRAYAAMSKISLPDGYRKVADPAGVVGAVVVESSGWVEDNLWYLEVAKDDPIIVGVVGRLDPTKPEFAEYLGRYAKNPLYQGIRTRGFFRTEEGRGVLVPEAVERLKGLADLDRALDTANPSIPLLEADLRLADAIPNLRIIIDHLPGFDPTPDVLPTYQALIRELAARPNIFVKLSQVYHPDADGKVSMVYEPIRARLEYLFGAFGEDRVMFGSDYPNSYGVATIPQAVEVMQRFYADKSQAAAEKYFWKNSARVYRWTPRTSDQPSLA